MSSLRARYARTPRNVLSAVWYTYGLHESVLLHLGFSSCKILNIGYLQLPQLKSMRIMPDARYVWDAFLSQIAVPEKGHEICSHKRHMPK